MSREEKSNGRVLRVQEIEGVLRHPDGSLDIAAYAKLAHRERATAIAACGDSKPFAGCARRCRLIRAGLAPAARSAPASGKHHAPAGQMSAFFPLPLWERVASRSEASATGCLRG